MTSRTLPIALSLMLEVIASCKSEPATDVPSPSASAEPGAPSSSFAWVAVRPGTSVAPEEYLARILRTGESEAVVVAPLPARIASVVKKPGDRVEKGDPIALVVMPELDAAGAMVAAAEASIAVLEARKQRLAGLAKEGLVREAEVSDLELELARHRADRLRGSAVLQSAGAPGGTVVLRSPLAGVLVEVGATLGELRRPEDGPLARIRGKAGQRVEATLPRVPTDGATYRLSAAGADIKLTLVNHASAPSGLGYLAWFEAGDGVELPAANEGRLRVGAATDTTALRLVPATAVGQEGEKHFVVVRVKGDDPSRRIDVELVRVSGAEALVRGALDEGQLVATAPDRAAAQLEGERSP
jgi:hypothetical protein